MLKSTCFTVRRRTFSSFPWFEMRVSSLILFVANIVSKAESIGAKIVCSRVSLLKTCSNPAACRNCVQGS